MIWHIAKPWLVALNVAFVASGLAARDGHAAGFGAFMLVLLFWPWDGE